jgi:hypothetical protein
MGLMNTTTPSRNTIARKLSVFWFKVWGLLVPVIVRVLSLIFLLLTNKEIYFVTGIEYVFAERLIIFIPLLLLSLMVKDSLRLLYSTRMRIDSQLMVKVVGSQ